MLIPIASGGKGWRATHHPLSVTPYVRRVMNIKQEPHTLPYLKAYNNVIFSVSWWRIPFYMKLSASIFVQPVAALEMQLGCRCSLFLSLWHKQNGTVWVIRDSQDHPYRMWRLLWLTVCIVVLCPEVWGSRFTINVGTHKTARQHISYYLVR
jgi:hypothetical protein